MPRKHKVKIKRLPPRNPTVAPMRTRGGNGKHKDSREKTKEKDLQKFLN